MKDRIVKTLDEIASLSHSQLDIIVRKLNILFRDLIEHNKDLLKLDLKTDPRIIEIGFIEEEFGINVGIKRSKNKIIIADWVFQKPVSSSMLYLQAFILLKESLVQFLADDFSDIETAIVNIISILYMKKIFVFATQTIDGTAFKAVDNKIYESDISGISIFQISALTTILFVKDISFIDVFNYFRYNILKHQMTDLEKFKKFASWVNSHLIDLDVIAPIRIKDIYLDTLNAVIELGSEDSRTGIISRKIGIHSNTVRKHLQNILAETSVFWRPSVNLSLLKLHNYFVKVVVKNEDSYSKAFNLIWSSPYIRTIFKGNDGNNIIIYSPTLTCPHIIADKFISRLSTLKKDKKIVDFSVARIYEKRHYGAITTRVINPTIEFFIESLEGKNDNIIEPKIFAVEKEDFKMEFDDEDKRLDYNLLFFLSILRSKFLTKKSYNVITTALPKLYEKNNIELSDQSAQIDFLNQIEIRARKRNILNYVFFMRSYSPRGSDVLIIELQNITQISKEIIDEITDKIQVFSCIGQIDIPNRKIFTVPGISHKHKVSKLIKNVLDVYDINIQYYTIKLDKTKLVPLHDLYDYDNQKWIL